MNTLEKLEENARKIIETLKVLADAFKKLEELDAERQKCWADHIKDNIEAYNGKK